MNKNTVIFDLDGTLADIECEKTKSHKGSPNGKAMDWDIFFDAENIKLDKPKPRSHQVCYKCLRRPRIQDCYLQRVETTAVIKATQEWLSTTRSISYDLLVLRPDKF